MKCFFLRQGDSSKVEEELTSLEAEVIHFISLLLSLDSLFSQSNSLFMSVVCLATH